MSEIDNFERYDEELRSLMQQIQEESSQGDQQDLLQQCDELIQQMALEARSMVGGVDASSSSSSSSLKDDLLAMVRTRKMQIQTLKQQMERQSLMVGADEPSVAKAPRVLQKNEDMLAKQNETLERAQRTMEETEAVGLEITKELGDNRDKLVSAHGKVKEMSGMTERANKILDSMNRRWFGR